MGFDKKYIVKIYSMHITDVQSQFSNSRVSMKKIFLAELLSIIYKHMISSKFRTNHRITLDI
jgi:hypothetical protein